MANIYCVATNTGKGFFTAQDRHDFFLGTPEGTVWVVGDNPAGIDWINRVNGVAKIKSEAQAIVDAKIEEAQAIWDDSSAEHKVDHPRKPEKHTLP